MTLAKRIRDHRYAKGWGPDELATRAEISRTALYQIECGKTETPRAGTLRRIACALDVSIDLLLDRDVVESESSESIGTHVEATALEDRDSLAWSMPDRETSAYDLQARPAVTSRDREIERKFRDLLASPLGEGVARIVEESHRLILPGILA